VQVLNITDAVHVVAGADHTCVLRQTGAVSCWGKGVALGDGIGNNRSTPADVAGLSGTVALDAHLGNHSCAIVSDRSVKCWGDNSVGQVDGSFVFAGKPVTVVLQ
jgi:alpha-tubulin suppressor-like RCC1 family protein